MFTVSLWEDFKEKIYISVWVDFNAKDFYDGEDVVLFTFHTG